MPSETVYWRSKTGHQRRSIPAPIDPRDDSTLRSATKRQARLSNVEVPTVVNGNARRKVKIGPNNLHFHAVPAINIRSASTQIHAPTANSAGNGKNRRVQPPA